MIIEISSQTELSIRSSNLEHKLHLELYSRLRTKFRFQKSKLYHNLVREIFF